MEASEDFVSQLPDELALRILWYLDGKEILQVAQTCQRWRQLAEDEGLWQGKCKAEGIEEPLCRTKSPWKSSSIRQLSSDNKWRRGRIRSITLDMNYWDICFTTWTFDGKELVCLGIKGTIKVWSAVSGKHLRTLVGHTEEIESMKMRDHLVVSGSQDQTVKVWNAESGECIRTLWGHAESVSCVFIHEGRVASGSRDGSIRIWDIKTGQRLHVLMVQLPNISFIHYDGHRVVSVDGTLKIWDPNTHSCLITFPSPIYDPIQHSELKGTWLLLVTDIGTITVWDTDTGQCIQTVTDLQLYIAAMSLKVSSLVSSPEGQLNTLLQNEGDLDILQHSQKFLNFLQNVRRNRRYVMIRGFEQMPRWGINPNFNMEQVMRRHHTVYDFLVSSPKLFCFFLHYTRTVNLLLLDFD